MSKNTLIRNLMESIDDIYSANEEEQPQEDLSPAELIKDIIGSLKEITNQISTDSIEDISNLTADLQRIAGSLQELLSSDEDEYDTNDNSDEELEEEYGTEEMGPTTDSDGTQNYEDPNGSSYPQKKGFVGI